MDKGIINLGANEKQVQKAPFPHELYALIEAEKEDVFIPTTSSAEAVNQVLLSVFLEISRKTGKCHFVISSIEDAPTLQMMKRLEDLGCFVKIVPVTARGDIDLLELENLISSRTALVSLTVAQGLTGVIQPTDEIAAICQKKNVLLHLEGSHAIGNYHVFMESDYLTFSSGLFARKKAPLAPLILGGNPHLYTAKVPQNLDELSLEMPRLRYFFEKEILSSIPDSKVLLQDSLRLPNTTVISFSHAHQEALHHLLRSKGVHSLVGGKTSQHLSALLEASQLNALDASCALSFSIPSTATEEELKRGVARIQEAVETLRSISTGEMALYDLKTHIKEPVKIPLFRFVGDFSEKEAKEKGMRLVKGQEKTLLFSFLVNETGGEIADVKFRAFGPLSLLKLGEAVAELLIGKDIVQASRITAELIEKHLKETIADTLINQTISAIDNALERCKDIECTNTEYETTPIEMDFSGNGLSNWEELTHPQKFKLIEEVIDQEIRPYIEMDAGGIQVLELKENSDVVISYEGACTTCPSATGSTLSAIQSILHARLSSTLTVIPQF